MKLLFLVNGSEESAAAIRAQAFAARLPGDWRVRIAYRPAKKWKGILPFVRLAAGFRPHILYVMDIAYTGVLAGCLAKALTGAQLVSDTGDVVYELLKSTGNYSAAALRLIKGVEQMALRRSDCVVVRGSYHKTLLEKRGLGAVVFIPDGVDLDAAKPIAGEALRAELGLTGHIVVGLLGTMSWSRKHQMCYGWDVIDAVGLLKDRAVKALIVGDGSGRAVLERRAHELGVAGQIVFTGRLPYGDLPRYISAMDVCVSTQSNDLVGQVRTTGKLPLYLACGKYVVATDVGEARRVLPGVGCLLPYQGVRDETYPSRLADHLGKVLARPAMLNVSTKARLAAKEHFDYGTLSSRVANVCEALLPSRSA